VGKFTKVTLEKKKISELCGIVGLESDNVIAIHLTTLRAWAIANAKWFQGKIDIAMDNKKKIEFFKNRKIADRSIRQNMAIRSFLIDRFEIKPEELV
jgi:hypothetical protein